MNLKKILTGIVAGAMAVSAMGVAAFAEVKDVDLSDLTGYTLDNNVFKVCEDWDGEVAIDEDVNVSFQLDETYSDNEMIAIQLAYVDGSWSWHHDYVDAVYSADETYKVTVPAGTYHMFQIAPSSEKDGKDDKLGSVCWQYNFKNVTTTTGEEDETPGDNDTEPGETETDVEVQMVVQNNADWATVTTAKAHVTGDGVYSFKITDLAIDPSTLTVIYIKDAYAIEQGDDLAKDYASKVDKDMKVSFVLKINDKEVAVKDTAPTTIGKDVFDLCLYNTWSANDTHIDLPEETINTVELIATLGEGGETVSVTGSGAPATEDPEETTSSDADPTDPEETTSSDADPTDPEETTSSDADVAGTGEGTGTPTGTGANPSTGVALAIVPAVIAAAGVIVAKKRK